MEETATDSSGERSQIWAPQSSATVECVLNPLTHVTTPKQQSSQFLTMVLDGFRKGVRVL
jgi:hypothetical protein